MAPPKPLTDLDPTDPTPPATPTDREQEAARRLNAVIAAVRAELRVEVAAVIVPLTDVPGGFRPIIRLAALPE